MQIGSVVDIGNQNGVPNRAYAIEAIDILRSFADFGDLTIDTPIGSIDGINKSFTLQFSPETAIITVNGIVVTNFTISDNTLLFVDAPPVGSEIRAYYNINGSLGITVETPTGDVDGINRIFSITKKPNTAIVTVNGIVVTNFILSGGRVLFVTAPPAGSEIRVYYNFGETVSVSIPNLSELNDVSGVPSEDFQMYAWRTATSRFQLVNPITGLKEPTGLNPIPTLSVVGSVLNITGSHTAWFRGEKYDKSTQTLEMSGFANGVWFVYYNSLGVLSSSQTPWSITDTIPIAIVYKNGTSYRLYDERHGTVMDSVTHQYLHETRGTAYIGGLAASFADTSLNLTSGSYADEDIKISITGANPFQVAIMYRNASLNWVWSSLQSNWWLVGTSGRPRYDNAGVLTDLASNQFGVYYIVATNDLTSPIVSLMGQAAYGTRAAARAASFNDLSFGTLPTPEFKVLYKVIVDATSSSGAFAESQDFRTNIQIPGAAPVLTSHSSLSGLTSDDHPQYALLNGRVGDVYTLAEVAEPTTASSGFGRLYIDSADSKIKFKDDAGVVFDLTSGGGGSMVYPAGSGIPIVVAGASWGTTITNNSANWNTAFGWGNHAGLYEPIITKSTGYLRYTGTAWEFKNETYSLSSHTHSGMITAAATPSDNQVAVFTGSSTIEGTANLVFTGTSLNVGGDVNIGSGYYLRINTNQAIYQSGTLFQFGWLGLGTSTRVYFGAISDGTAAIYTANTQRVAVLVTGEFRILTSLQVNTINEYTATNGVLIDGVLLKDGFVRLTKIVEPSIPAAGYALIYSDSGDSILKYKNSDGAVWDLSSNKHQIILNATPSVNQTADGIKTYLTAGTNMSFGTIVYINSTAGSVYGADANVASTTPAIGILLSSTSTGNPVEVLLHGIVRNDLWNWTVGGKLYLSETSGELTQTVPTTSGATIQVMGIATHADRILFNPSNDTILLS